MNQRLQFLYLAMHGLIGSDTSSDLHTEIRIGRQKNGRLCWGANCLLPWDNIYLNPETGEWWAMALEDMDEELRESVYEIDFGDLPIPQEPLSLAESEELEKDILGLHMETWDRHFEDDNETNFSWELRIGTRNSEGKEEMTEFEGSNLVPRDMQKLLGILLRLEPELVVYADDIDEDASGRVLADNRMPQPERAEAQGEA